MGITPKKTSHGSLSIIPVFLFASDTPIGYYINDMTINKLNDKSVN